MWDAYQDFDGLVNNFIDNYYKTAAKEIREYYDYLRSVFEILKGKGVYDGNIYGKALYSTCWTYDNMLQIERIFDRAFAANEAVKEMRSRHLRACQLQIDYRIAFLQIRNNCQLFFLLSAQYG